MLCVVPCPLCDCELLLVACCWLRFVCRLSFDVCNLLVVVICLLCVDYGVSVSCALCDVCSLMCVDWLLIVVGLVGRCLFFVDCCVFCAVR